jgi:ribose/xylose/arabinose/galactoside ABC-type transport system permease subunit
VVGQLFVLLVGGIDLSAAAVVGLASVLGAKAMAAVPNPAVGAAAGLMVMLAVGLAVGAFHGLAVAGLRMPAFLVTMATLTAVGGLSLWVTQSKPITDLPKPFLKLMGGVNGVWVAAGVCGVAHLLLTRTVYGRHLMAVGLNPAAARVSGVPVGWRVGFAFAASGLCSGIAAALYTARLEAGSATLVPKELLLDVLGAAVIGGASLRGGRGSVIGVVVGVAVIALIGNSLTLLDLDYWHVVMAKGGLIFLAAGLDVLRTRGQT